MRAIEDLHNNAMTSQNLHPCNRHALAEWKVGWYFTTRWWQVNWPKRWVVAHSRGHDVHIACLIYTDLFSHWKALIIKPIWHLLSAWTDWSPADVLPEAVQLSWYPAYEVQVVFDTAEDLMSAEIPVNTQTMPNQTHYTYSIDFSEQNLI